MSSAAQTKREGNALTLVASLAAHGLVALLVARTSIAPRSTPSPPNAPIDDVVELEWHPAPAPLEVTPDRPDEPAIAPQPVVARVDVTRPVPPPVDTASSNEPPANEPPATASAAPAGPAGSPAGPAGGAPHSLASIGVGKNPFLPGRNDVDPGAGSAKAAAPSPPPGADMADAKARVEASLRASAREREAEIGLGPEGPVREALGAAMYESNAPVIGRVVFAVSADAQGHVLSVETVSADRTLADYAGMLAIARRKLGRATLRLPSTAKGARLRVEVTSAWKLPSGHDPGIDLSLFGQSFKKGEGKTATRVEVLPLPKVICTEVDESKSGVKMPTCVLSAPILATDGDPADIGAKPRRIVGTKVIERTVL